MDTVDDMLNGSLNLQHHISFSNLVGCFLFVCDKGDIASIDCLYSLRNLLHAWKIIAIFNSSKSFKHP